MEGAEARACGLLWASLMMACTAPLVADEAVPCEDIPCVSLSGAEDEGFGAAVATDGERVWVAASGSGLVRAYSRLGEVQAEWALDPGEVELAVVPEGLLVDGATEWLISAEGAVSAVPELPGAPAGELRRVHQCPDGTWVAAPGAEARVRCSEAGLLQTRCEAGGCEVLRDGVVVGETTPAGALAWRGAAACWGQPGEGEDPAPGGWTCDDGSSGQGLDGDHLGRALTEDYVAGVFDKWTVPARARVLALDGGPGFALDRSAWGGAVSLAQSHELLVMGLPESGGARMADGRVFLVEGP